MRSKLRIWARRLHMEKLHRERWGDRPQQENKANIDLMSKAELLEMARELLGIAPPPKPPLG